MGMRITKGFLINVLRLVLIPFLNFAHIWDDIGKQNSAHILSMDLGLLV